MALAIIYSRAASGITAPLVTVETHLSFGMAGFFIVGLAEATVKESRDRVRSALMNSQFEFPSRRITVNLAPADLPKEGGRFDLPIALGILAASGQIPLEVLSEYEFAGELALSGALRPVRAVLPIAIAAHQANRVLIVPEQNAPEAAILQHAHVLSAKHLLDVCMYLKGEQKLSRCVAEKRISKTTSMDLSDVKGQVIAKRALEIAAAGKHSLLYVGPPGTGKTMLANRFQTLLPELNDEEAMEVAAIYSVSRAGFNASSWKQIPYRAPHHTSSSVALVGGGRAPCPGEISLAHKGVLFLDELPEFNRHVLECLREPLESGSITISRANFQTIFPAQFQLIAAMNPCPCGYASNLSRTCECSPDVIKRYMGKISGPLLDRIDMQIEVARLPHDLLTKADEYSETSEIVKQRVIAAHNLQMRRQKKYNALLTAAEISCYARLHKDAYEQLNRVMTKFNFSARVFHRLIKVSRTIADLAGETDITVSHVAEAISYRCFDKFGLSF